MMNPFLFQMMIGKRNSKPTSNETKELKELRDKIKRDRAEDIIKRCAESNRKSKQ